MPKNLYMTSSDENVDKERTDEGLLGPDAIYHTAYAVKDFPHEVITYSCMYYTWLVQGAQRGCVIT